MSTQLQPRLFTVVEFHQMAEAGIFGPEDRVELIEGQVLSMGTIGPHHASIVDRLTALCTSRLGSSVIVRVQNPIILDNYSEPQPDLTILLPRKDFYRTAHPGPDAVLLAIEVADSSEKFDLGVKARLYARTGIRETWVLSLRRNRVAVFRGLRDGHYEEQLTLRRGDQLTAELVPELSVTVDELLG